MIIDDIDNNTNDIEYYYIYNTINIFKKQNKFFDEIYKISLNKEEKEKITMFLDFFRSYDDKIKEIEQKVEERRKIKNELDKAFEKRFLFLMRKGTEILYVPPNFIEYITNEIKDTEIGKYIQEIINENKSICNQENVYRNKQDILDHFNTNYKYYKENPYERLKHYNKEQEKLEKEIFLFKRDDNANNNYNNGQMFKLQGQKNLDIAQIKRKAPFTENNNIGIESKSFGSIIELTEDETKKIVGADTTGINKREGFNIGTDIYDITSAGIDSKKYKKICAIPVRFVKGRRYVQYQ